MRRRSSRLTVCLVSRTPRPRGRALPIPRCARSCAASSGTRRAPRDGGALAVEDRPRLFPEGVPPRGVRVKVAYAALNSRISPWRAASTRRSPRSPSSPAGSSPASSPNRARRRAPPGSRPARRSRASLSAAAPWRRRWWSATRSGPVRRRRRGPLPRAPALSLAAAAAFPVCHGTAHLALCERARVAPNERVLVLGAAGGVGLAAVQIAKARGALRRRVRQGRRQARRVRRRRSRRRRRRRETPGRVRRDAVQGRRLRSVRSARVFEAAFESKRRRRFEGFEGFEGRGRRLRPSGGDAFASRSMRPVGRARPRRRLRLRPDPSAPAQPRAGEEPQRARGVLGGARGEGSGDAGAVDGGGVGDGGEGDRDAEGGRADAARAGVGGVRGAPSGGRWSGRS